MTAPHDPRGSRDLTPAQDDAVRRLLADAADDPAAARMPDDVRLRLESTLSDLSAERAAGRREVGADDAGADPALDPGSDPEFEPGAAPAVALRSRRRRRVARTLLAAAAAVVVVGIGLQWSDQPVDEVMGALSDSDPDRGDAGGSAESGADSGADSAADSTAGPQDTEDPESSADSGASELQRDGSAARDSDLGSDPGSDAATSPTEQLGRTGLLADAERRVVDGPVAVVRGARLRADLIRLQRRALPRTATVDYGRTVLTAPKGFTCTRVRPGRGILVAVRYQRSPAVVAFREPAGATQVAEVLQCGTGDVLRSASLPARG